MNFVPEQPKDIQQVPYFDDVTKEAGWQGQATEKNIATLQSEIIVAIGRLGGLVTGFQKGTFDTGKVKREGFRIHYAVEASDGSHVPGRIDIAALPVRPDTTRSNSIDRRRQASLKMALYMLRMALDGTWFLQQLSPGYAALVPFMLGQGDKTLSQMWSESPIMNRLLPPGEEEFIDGEIVDSSSS
jgi:hypothetical protein